MPFLDRADAGKQLAKALEEYRSRADAVVVALPRGGVVTGRVVADALGLPLDIVVPRKVGADSNPEYAIGAVTESGHVFWNEEERRQADPAYLEKTVAAERAEAERRLKTYRAGRPPRDFKDKTIIIVDDGAATGLTMFAALETAKALGAKETIAALPVAPPETTAKLKKAADRVICLRTPALFFAIGQFYEDFGQTSDEEVVELMKKDVKLDAK